MEQSEKPTNFGMIGITIGSLGLLVAIIHFWSGPFAPQPALSIGMGETAASFRLDAFNSLFGNAHDSGPFYANWTADNYLDLATTLLAGLAIIFAIVSFVKNEPVKTTVAAATLGIVTFLFQIIVLYVIVILALLAIFYVWYHLSL